MAKSIMIQGTASGVGKTILTMALCRIFKEDGYRTAPFKSQNMTSNTALIGSGEEIAVSQILQAKASGIEPDVTMNPIILKPTPENRGTQLILNGISRGTIDAYNITEIKQSLKQEVIKAYETLNSKYDVIVIEGAGSPVELNLNKEDIVNMGVAKLANAPVVLVADIDRGGVFASLYGTISLLGESERSHIKATIVNRFRGEASYFTDGVAILERITGVPVAGVVPYITFSLPDEDKLVEAGNVAEGSSQEGAVYSPDGNYEEEFSFIADHVRKSLDMDLIYKILQTGI